MVRAQAKAIARPAVCGFTTAYGTEKGKDKGKGKGKGKAMATIYTGADYISSSDVNDRIGELEEQDQCQDCGESLSNGEICSATVTIISTGTGQLYDPVKGSFITRSSPVLFETSGTAHEQSLSFDEESELEDLRALRDEAISELAGSIDASDWNSGYITLTSTYELGETWARERADDLGYLDKDSFIAGYVDWDEVADYFKDGEPYVTYKGYDYYYL